MRKRRYEIGFKLHRITGELPLDLFCKFKAYLSAKNMSITDWLIDKVSDELKNQNQ